MITFLINRARRHWQVLSTLVFGVIISTAFLASGPLLVNTVMNFALPHKIRSSLVENGSIFLSTYNNQGAETFEELDSEITNILVKNISEISEVFHGISSPWAFPLEEDALIADERINLRSFPGIESRIEIISGSWPCDSELEISSFQALISKQISAVDDISFEVDDGKLALIRGRSGSGKTTLLNLIAALDQPIRGNIHIGNLFSCPTVLMMSLREAKQSMSRVLRGSNLLDYLHFFTLKETAAGCITPLAVTPGQMCQVTRNLSITEISNRESIEYRRKMISFIFQTFGLLPYLTVEENVEVPLRLVKTPRIKRQERVADVLALVSLAHRAKHRTYELSGELQRVAKSQALVNRPSILLADEPTGQLDSNTGASIIRLLREIADQFGVTVIVASHDPNMIQFADTIIELQDGKLVSQMRDLDVVEITSAAY